MDEQIERRAFPVSMEVRRSDASPPKIRGHAAVFDRLSEDLGGFRERIRPGAFTKTLQEADVRALFNHDPMHVLGRTKSGTLTLREDGEGLAFEVEPPDAEWARALAVSIERGDVDQASFAFRTVKDRFTEEAGGTVRELLEVQLYDVSPVTYPAYTQTSVEVRSADPAERLLRASRLMQAVDQFKRLAMAGRDRI